MNKSQSRVLHKCYDKYRIISKVSLMVFMLIAAVFPPVHSKGIIAHNSEQSVLFKYAKDIQQNGLIEMSAVKRIHVRENEAPKDAIHDDLIVLGRKTLHTVKAGSIILSSDCFTPTQARLASKIDSIQGTYSMRSVAFKSATKMQNDGATVKAIVCRRDIRSGQILELSDISMKKIPLTELSSHQAMDIWTIWHRPALRNLKKGDLIQLEDFLPPQSIQLRKLT